MPSSNRVPRIKMLRGERNREFTLPSNREVAYLAVLPFPLCDVATTRLDTGLRSLDGPQVRVEPVRGAKFGGVTILSGKSKNSKSRNVPIGARRRRSSTGMNPNGKEW